MCAHGAPRIQSHAQAVGRSDARIIAAVEACPTGALEYEMPGRTEAAPDPLEITPLPDGPLLLRGDVVVRDEAGNVLRRARRVALCRCGRSRNKPFCDNSHRDPAAG